MVFGLIYGSIYLLLGLFIAWPLTLTTVVAISAPFMTRAIRKRRYFAGDKFLTHKSRAAPIVSEHNEIASYASSIRQSGSFAAASIPDDAAIRPIPFQHSYSRCSLEAVNSAIIDPAESLICYLAIDANEVSLIEVEKLGDDTFRLERALANVLEREADTIASFDPPKHIVKRGTDTFLRRVGMTIPRTEVPYRSHTLEYIGVHKSRSRRTTITENMATIDALIEALFQKVQFPSDIAAQRLPMTTRLRAWVLSRDNYTCRQCSASAAVDTHLLLEVDYIVPLAAGGLSTAANLQTLCWRCARANRTPVL